MRVVIDTNAWLSRLLIADSVTAKAIDRALIECEILVSDQTVKELADVLSREKFDRYVSLEDRQQFIRRLLQVATIVPVLSVITECRDPKDDKLLALALDSEGAVSSVATGICLRLTPGEVSRSSHLQAFSKKTFRITFK